MTRFTRVWYDCGVFLNLHHCSSLASLKKLSTDVFTGVFIPRQGNQIKGSGCPVICLPSIWHKDTFFYFEHCNVYFLRYDDYGPPPERGYPSRDYDRGGYSERERERPPSYGNDYGSRYDFIPSMYLLINMCCFNCCFKRMKLYSPSRTKL